MTSIAPPRPKKPPSNRKGWTRWIVVRLFLVFVVIATYTERALKTASPRRSIPRSRLDHAASQKASTIVSGPFESKDRLNAQLAYDASGGFFYDISDESWNLTRAWAQRTPQYMYPDEPDRDSYSHLWWYLNNLEPVLSCPRGQRVGGVKGLGLESFFVCDPMRVPNMSQPCLVYAFRSYITDFSFEEELLELVQNRCEVHVFGDIHPRAKPTPPGPSIHHHPWILVSSYDSISVDRTRESMRTENRLELATFAEIRSRLNHTTNPEILLMDCEGCEWTTFQDWLVDSNNKGTARQILIHLHGLPNVGGPSDLNPSAGMNTSAFTEKLADLNYVLVSKNMRRKRDNRVFSYLRLDEPLAMGPFRKDLEPLKFREHNPEAHPKTRLAYEQSLGWLTDVTDSQWHYLQEHVHDVQMYHQPQDPNSGLGDGGFTWYHYNLQPNFHCPHKWRVGTKYGHGEGAKWICDPLRLQTIPNCLIYSVGCMGDYSFEDTLAVDLGLRENCEIHVFDPGNYSRPDDPTNKNIHYHQWGLKGNVEGLNYTAHIIGKKVNNIVLKTFQETLRELNHEGRPIHLLKLDCEGCEWLTFRELLKVDFHQILIEVHSVPNGKKSNFFPANVSATPSEFFNTFWENQYVMYSKERNPLGAMNCVEFSYLKLHEDFFALKQAPLP